MRKATLKAILCAGAAAAVAAGGISLAFNFEKRHTAVPTSEPAPTVESGMPANAPSASPAIISAVHPEKVIFNGQEYKWREELSTLLMMGIDDEKVDEEWVDYVDSQADVLILAVFNNEANTCSLLQIDRNTMVNVPVLDENNQYLGDAWEQICLAHDYGSTPEIRCQNTEDTVSTLLYDLPIDNYISLAMGGIVAMNDVVGGVTVPIEDDFTGVDDTLIKGETVTLHGEHAEKYLRARMYMQEDATNETRMRRHRTYVNNLIEQTKTKLNEDAGFAMEAYAALDEYLVTDCDMDELMTYVTGLSNYTLGDWVTMEGVTEVHEHEEFYPDQEALMQLVVDMFYEPYTEN